MKEITKEEFLQAVDVIERYQKQLNEQIISIDNGGKTPVQKWRPYLEGCISGRLISALYGWDHSYNKISKPNFEFIEDITRMDFLRVRNAGTHTWNEFVKFRGY